MNQPKKKKKRKKKKKEKIKIVLICKILCMSETFLLTLYWLKVTQTPQCNFVQALFSETVNAWKVVRKSSYFKSLLSLMSYLLKLHYPTNRSSHRRWSVRKDVLWNFAKFTGKHLCQSLIKKETLTQVFSCEFCKISKSTFLTEHLWTTASKRIKTPLCNEFKSSANLHFK